MDGDRDGSLVVTMMFTLPTAGDVATGYRGHSYAGFGAESSGGAGTGQKPVSKSWFHDGSWWAAMLAPAEAGAHAIHRLPANAWVDTGVLIDPRPATKEHMLSLDSGKLYILSRAVPSVVDRYLRRYTYADGVYHLDVGYPVAVPGGSTETATIARDGDGILWITYVRRGAVQVAHPMDDDTRWSSAFVLPVDGAAKVTSDDISAAISFNDATGPAVGVMWANQNTDRQYFAIHRDGAVSDDWTVETALAGNLEADDHLDLEAHDGGTYAVVKTNANENAARLIRLLTRSPSGAWKAHPAARRDEKRTRPMTLLQLDPVDRRIHVSMTQGTLSNARGIRFQSTTMSGIGFPTASSWLIQGDYDEPVNDVTSTEQNATAASGIIVLASNGRHCWWNRIGGAMSADPDPNPEPPGAEDNALAYTAVSIRNRRHTAGPGFIERAEAKSGSGGSATGLAALDGPPIDPSSTAVTGSLNDPTDWASVTATLRGAP